MNKVRYTDQDLPAASIEDMQRLESLAAMPDEAIDTDDLPEMSEEQWAESNVMRLYRPNKQQLTVKLDADVLAWLKSGGARLSDTHEGHLASRHAGATQCSTGWHERNSRFGEE